MIGQNEKVQYKHN